MILQLLQQIEAPVGDWTNLLAGLSVFGEAVAMFVGVVLYGESALLVSGSPASTAK